MCQGKESDEKARGCQSDGNLLPIMEAGFVFMVGGKRMDLVTNQIVPGSAEPETRRILENIKAILEETGSNVDLVV